MSLLRSFWGTASSAWRTVIALLRSRQRDQQRVGGEGGALLPRQGVAVRSEVDQRGLLAGRVLRSCLVPVGLVPVRLVPVDGVPVGLVPVRLTPVSAVPVRSV